MKVSLISHTPNAEQHIAYIARVSSSRKNKLEDFEKLISYLIKHKHWSPFEHSFMTFDIETSKAIGIQLLRHRSFTFQEFSQRYQDVNILGESIFEDIQLRKQAKNNRQSSEDEISSKEAYLYELVEIHLNQTKDLYNTLLNGGVARETARMILPMATKTVIRMTGSIRSWIHFIDIRSDGHSQLEMQAIANEVKRIFYAELPIIAKAIENNK